MTKRNLAAILKLQWWLHTFLTSLFFIAVTFFFLFVIEDYLHEQQLIDISRIVALNELIAGMPAHIQMYSANTLPPAWIAVLEQTPLNEAIEIDNQQGEAIHILRSKFSNNDQVFVLTLDTSKTNSVWAISDKLLILILPWIIIFLAMASFLAKRFIRQIQGHFKLLLTAIKESESPDALQQFSQTQAINEFSQFAQLFSQVWQQKVEILAREKQGLEYLSHELRTPIQSSLATLELLALKTEDKKTIERLTRSLNRMTRLSNSILCLMESEKQLPTYQVDIMKICHHLVDELTPLAKMKQQTIAINTIAARTHATKGLDNQDTITKKTLAENTLVKFDATQEAMETLLSILLTNALQHSNNSPVTITISQDQISITNEIEQEIPPQHVSNQHDFHHGFGIGLTIAQRLADKFNLSLVILFNEKSQAIATISKQ